MKYYVFKRNKTFKGQSYKGAGAFGKLGRKPVDSYRTKTMACTVAEELSQVVKQDFTVYDQNGVEHND